MSEERFELGKMPQINVTACHGDLVIRSWAEPVVLVKGSEVETETGEDELTLSSLGSLKLIVPADSNLSLEKVDGDLVVKNVNGRLHIGEVSGDAVLADASSLKIGTAHGDLIVKQISNDVNSESIFGDAVFRHLGSLALDKVYGDTSVTHIDGTVTINEVMGDFSLRHIGGDIAISRVHRDAAISHLSGKTEINQVEGDLQIEAPIGAGTFKANGDIELRWTANEAIDLVANGAEITSKIAFDKVVEGDGSITAVHGKDGPEIILNAQGDIMIKDKKAQNNSWGDFNLDFDFDFGSFGEQINEHMTQFASTMEEKFGPAFSQNIAEKFAHQAEAAAAKAEKAAQRAARRAEKQAKRHARQHEQHGRSSRAAAPPSPPRQTASKEEQLKILGMVEKGIISPEEANTLLKALEN